MAPSFLDLCVQFPPTPPSPELLFIHCCSGFLDEGGGGENLIGERERGERGRRTDGWTNDMDVCVCVPRGFCPGSQSFRRIDRLASDGEEEDGGEEEDLVCSCVCWM